MDYIIGMQVFNFIISANIHGARVSPGVLEPTRINTRPNGCVLTDINYLFVAMDIVGRDCLLPRFVEEMHVEWSGWDELAPLNPNPIVPTTFADFDAARGTCTS